MEDSKENYRKYHPYQDIYTVPAEKLYNLPTSPQYLFDEEAKRQRRSWSENLQYYTGTGYLSGAILGAAKGSIDGIRSAESGDSLKLRLNRILNSGGHMGRKFGNNLGVVGLMFAGLESGLIYWRDSNDFLNNGLRMIGNEDVVNTVLAGLATGAIYRAGRGPRSAAVAGAIGGVAAAVAVAGKHAVKRYVPI